MIILPIKKQEIKYTTPTNFQQKMNFKGVNSEKNDTFQYSQEKITDLTTMVDEKGKQRFTREQTDEITKQIKEKPFIAELSSKLVLAGDKNDEELSKLMFLEGGNVSYNQQNFSSPRFQLLLEENHVDGYDVKPRFKFKEIKNILDATTEDTVSIAKKMVVVENKQTKQNIKKYLEKNRALGFNDLANLMQNRKELSFNPLNRKPIFEDEVAGHNSDGIVKVLKNIDKYNKNEAEKVISATSKDGNLVLNSNGAVEVLSTISNLKKDENYSESTSNFLDYLLNANKINSDASRFDKDGKEISALLNIHQDDTAVQYRLKKLIEEPEINKEQLDFTKKELTNIDDILDVYLQKQKNNTHSKSQFFNLSELIKEKNKPQKNKNTVEEILKQMKSVIKK